MHVRRGVIQYKCLSSGPACEFGNMRLANGVCQLRHDQMEQGGRSTFLLNSGGAGGGWVLLIGPLYSADRY